MTKRCEYHGINETSYGSDIALTPNTSSTFTTRFTRSSQALQDKDITIYGTGEQTRSFQFVDDLVNGLMKLMNGDYDQPTNIGNPDEYTVNEFAKYIKELTNSKR